MGHHGWDQTPGRDTPRGGRRGRPRSRRGSAALVGLAMLLAAGCGSEVELLAADACDLAQRIADDDIGLLALGLELDNLSRELRDASVSARALREAMSEICPEVVDELPL